MKQVFFRHIAFDHRLDLVTLDPTVTALNTGTAMAEIFNEICVRSHHHEVTPEEDLSLGNLARVQVFIHHRCRKTETWKNAWDCKFQLSVSISSLTSL